MPPVSTTTRTTSPRKRRPHGKLPSAGTTSTRSSGSPKFERSEYRRRIERSHQRPDLSLPGVSTARPSQASLQPQHLGIANKFAGMANQYNRREFMGVAMAGAAGIAARPVLSAADTDPDLVVVNAKTYTMDARLPRADAFAVSDGKFTAVGSTSEMRSLARRRTRVIDAKRMTIVPGFIDCHSHAVGTMVLYETLVGNPYQVEYVTIDSIVEKLKVKAQKTPAGYWVEGYFLDDTKLKDKRAPTIRDLDRISSEHPVAVHHRGGHTSFYNSKAFELAKITKSTPVAGRGAFDRDATGELTGRVTERARDVFYRVGKEVEISPAERAKRERDGLAYMSEQFVRSGLTGVHHQGGDLRALQDVRARGDLKHRVSYEPYSAVLDSMIASGIESGFGDAWIRFGATAEHTVDGSFSERTMSMS